MKSTVLFEFYDKTSSTNSQPNQSIRMSETRRRENPIPDGHFCHSLQSISEVGEIVSCLPNEFVSFFWEGKRFSMWRKLIASEHQSGHRRHFIILVAREKIWMELQLFLDLIDTESSNTITFNELYVNFAVCFTSIVHYSCVQAHDDIWNLRWPKNQSRKSLSLLYSVAHYTLVVLRYQFHLIERAFCIHFINIRP